MIWVRKILGWVLIALGMLFTWFLRFALFIGLCVVVAIIFIDNLAENGLLSAFIGAGFGVLIGGFISWLLFMLFSWIGIGLVLAGSKLAGNQ